MKVLVDSDALYALYLEADLMHGKAVGLFRDLVDRKAVLYVSNVVLQEVATLLSYRCGQEMARNFLKDFVRGGFKNVFLDEELTRSSWTLFQKQTKKGTSFVDCSNVVLYREFNFEAIFSFDKFYSRNKIDVGL